MISSLREKNEVCVKVKETSTSSLWNGFVQQDYRYGWRGWKVARWFGFQPRESTATSLQVPSSSGFQSAPTNAVLGVPVPRRPGWKSVTLKAPVLGSVIAISLAIIIILEVLYHNSTSESNGGGVSFASSSGGIPSAVTFWYLYFPTIMAVCYSMMWSWVDLDVKRLEPWLQLSNPMGAAAKDSLLLQYPFDFLPFIPITAFRRRHWAVSIAGSIMLLVFWMITPLQSAIFNTGLVTRSIATKMATSAKLYPIEQQKNLLNANFLNTAYGVSWLGQKRPAFTTGHIALLPFSPVPTTVSHSENEIWVTTAKVYNTNLTCTPAQIDLKPKGYTFSNGRGCSVSDIALAYANNDTQHLLLYIGYYSNDVLDWSLQNPNCTREHSDNFLAIWASTDSELAALPGTYSNLSAIFCQPRYQIQDAVLQVNASDGTVNVDDIKLTQGSNISVRDNINTTHFEYILGVGIQPLVGRANFPDSALVEQFPQLSPYNLTWPVSNMVGFAVALNSAPIAELNSPEVLQEVFQRAHQLLFTVAFSTLTDHLNTSEYYDFRPGAREDTIRAIVMVRTISLLVEAALALVIILTATLWWYSASRQSLLSGDPASIVDIMSIIQMSHVSEAFRDNETLTEASLSEELSLRVFKIALKDSEVGQIVSLECDKRRSKSSASTDPTRPGKVPTERIYPSVRPAELKLSVGLTLTISILLALIGIIFLDIWSERKNGISLPSRNPIVLTILENYLPTVFATLLEPAWVMLNRVLCLLQPFDELRKGNARASTTIMAKYTSLPPQMVVWRAIRSRHFLLAAVCSIAVSTNLLAVSLSGLIAQGDTITNIPIASKQHLTTEFGGLPIQPTKFNFKFYPHYYVAMSNATENTTLPAWMDHKTFYIPFEIGNIPISTDVGTPLKFQSLRGITAGLGADLDCVELSPGIAGDNKVMFRHVPEIQGVNFSTFHLLQNGSQAQCIINDDYHSSDTTQVITGPFFNVSSALEVFSAMKPFPGIPDGGYCSSLIIGGWVRLSPALNGTQRRLNSTFIGCTPTFRASTYEVDVDQVGHIINSKPHGNLSSTESFPNASAQADFMNQANKLIAQGSTSSFKWHNDTLTSDWFNSLLGYRMHSDALVNPGLPPPTFVHVTAMTKALYTQLFSILLGLDTHVLKKATNPKSITVNFIVEEPRFFISPIMFRMTIIILGIHLLVAIWYYSDRPKRFLPRMPTSIASIIGFVYASRAVDDFGDARPDSVNAESQRYAYGRFIGTDGRTHVGIERQRYVVPLKSKNPEARRRKWGWRFGKSDEREPRNWI